MEHTAKTARRYADRALSIASRAMKGWSYGLDTAPQRAVQGVRVQYVPKKRRNVEREAESARAICVTIARGARRWRAEGGIAPQFATLAAAAHLCAVYAERSAAGDFGAWEGVR